MWNTTAISSPAVSLPPLLSSLAASSSTSEAALHTSVFEAMFKDHFHLDDHDVVSIRLFHFVRASKLIRESDLAAFYTLGAGIVLDRGHAAIDLVIPIKIKRQHPLSEKFSAVLIQVKNHARRISPNLALTWLQNMSLLRAISSNTTTDDKHLELLQAWRKSVCARNAGVLPEELQILSIPVIKVVMTLRDNHPEESVIYHTGDAIQCVLRGFPSSMDDSIVKPLQCLVADRADFAAKLSLPWDYHCAQLLKEPHVRRAEPFNFESDDVLVNAKAISEGVCMRCRTFTSDSNLRYRLSNTRKRLPTCVGINIISWCT
jgi:hypothetical protein